MKKILNIFASISLITTGATSVVACGSSSKSTFNPFNLSTWGYIQIDMIENTYLSDWKKQYKTGEKWSDTIFFSTMEIQNLLTKINPFVNIGVNCEVIYYPQPTQTDDTKSLFNNGLRVYVQEIETTSPYYEKGEVQGGLNFILKL